MIWFDWHQIFDYSQARLKSMKFKGTEIIRLMLDSTLASDSHLLCINDLRS